MKKRGDGPPESVDKGTLATLRREGQAQFTCAAKPRSERAFTKPGLAGFVIILTPATVMWQAFVYAFVRALMHQATGRWPCLFCG